MCGRTALTLGRERLVSKCTGLVRGGGEDSTAVPTWSEAPCGGQYQPSPNISPSLYTPVLYRRGEELLLQPMMWGLVPPTHPGPRPASHGLSTNNCRLETVRTSGLYSPCLESRRCVVVCQGFYEWLREGGEKQPYLVFRPGPSQPLLYLAGLYSVWRGPGGEPVLSYTIITRQSNSVLAWLHHRMPAFLQPHQVWEWLDTDLSPSQALELLHLPLQEELEWHKVSRTVGNSRNQDLSLMEKLEEKPGGGVSGFMKSWLTAGTKSSEMVSQASKPTVKKKTDKNPIMTNWLKRGKCEEDAEDKHCNKSMKLE